jgi:hypothetical protein
MVMGSAVLNFFGNVSRETLVDVNRVARPKFPLAQNFLVVLAERHRLCKLSARIVDLHHR